jgi:FAD-dependent urate hydroxylase
LNKCDIAIIGAGPYGLSAAAHLRTIKGIDVHVFGEPMSFWSENMPNGMFLRSNWTATQIACPNGDLTLEAFQAERKRLFGTPVPVEEFIAYGMWYQSRAVPDVDRRRIRLVESTNKAFKLTINDGDILEARRVVIAGGIGQFARRPAQFAELPKELVSHTSEHSDFAAFTGKRVLVIGSGQSALESAALLFESGADVQVVGRARQIHWLQGTLSSTLHHRLGKTVRRFLYAPTDVGPAGISQLLARPNILKFLPRDIQDKLRKRAIRPAGARWLVARLHDVPITLGCSVGSIIPHGESMKVSLGNGKDLVVDHVLLGTGFQIDVSKYEFLAPDLLRQVERVNGFPKLKTGLETSVSGLHVIGAPASYSFGPLLMFVSGSRFASQSLTRHVRSVITST